MTLFSAGFAFGLVLGFVFSIVAIRYFERQSPDQRPKPDGSAPFVKRKQERRKPVVFDEYKEWQKEQERLKETGR